MASSHFLFAVEIILGPAKEKKCESALPNAKHTKMPTITVLGASTPPTQRGFPSCWFEDERIPSV